MSNNNTIENDVLLKLYNNIEVDIDKSSHSTVRHKILTVIGIIASIIFLPILIVNLVLLTRCFDSDKKVPAFMGYSPMIVLSNSMTPVFDAGDMIIIKEKSAQQVQRGDIIAYFSPTAKNKTNVVTHRVVAREMDNGETRFRTRGDANNTNDIELVSPSKVIGEYKTRIKGLGDVVMFMQTTQGFIICVGVPLILLIVYDTIRRNKYSKKNGQKMEDLLCELNDLKKQHLR